ncbi:MAG TPA: phosphate ABC transporter permease PstA [Erysipelothrix sp.]
MNAKRKRMATFLNGITKMASLVSVVVLLLIFSFIFKQGAPRLNKDLLFSQYWAENFVFEKTVLANDFSNDDAQGIYASQFGIGLEDATNHHKEKVVKVVYLAEGHPFEAMKVNQQIESIEITTAQGIETIGPIYGDNAESTIAKLETAKAINFIYYKSDSGGIWGSLKATLMLIGLSLVFALPIGLFTAIYLSEIAHEGKFKHLVQSSIELLAGVPSIVFGLMGVVVLYPITAFFKVEGLSILLGSLTMAVILLPIIIRTIQESLEVVPSSYRFASYALGATEIETIFKVVIPSALPGILSAVLLAVSRIIGESAALIYTMGSFINDAPKLNQAATSLAVHIWSIMSQEQPDFALASAISLIILLIVLILNVSVKLLGRRLNKGVVS